MSIGATAVKLAGIVIAGAISTGCSLCQMATVKLADETLRGPVYGMAVMPYGADRALVRFHELSFGPRTSPPFVVIFPDGHRASIRDIDRSVIEAHLGPVTREKPDGPLRATYEGLADTSYLRMGALLGEDGQLWSMWLQSSGPTATKVIATADGTQEFALPFTVDDFQTLLGRPVKVRWEPVGTVYGECHD